MRLRDYIALGWDQLRRRKVVTLLCVMGIAIGSASIVVALAFGESVTHYTSKQMSFYMKIDEITIFNNQGRGEQPSQPSAGEPDYRLTPQKLQIIRSMPHVKTVAGYKEMGHFSFTADETKMGSLQLKATDVETLADFGVEFQQGAPSELDNTIILSYPATVGIRDKDAARVAAASRAVVTDGDPRKAPPPVAYPLYRKQIMLSTEVMLGNGTVKTLEFPVRVVAIEKRADGLTDDRLRYTEKTAYISHGLAKQIQEAIAAANPSDISASREYMSDQVKVKVDSSANVESTDKLIQSLHLNTMNNLRWQESMNQEFAIVRLILGGAGGFILFVASISIVVAMTMSTHQRRRQIGIMKVLGANLKQIRNMFVVESALLGLFGGLAGILCAYWVVWGINIIILKFSGTPSGPDAEILFISGWIVPLGLFFAMLTGILSGIFPAMKASRTDALTAIKRE